MKNPACLYRAALYCEHCTLGIMKDLDDAGKRPADPSDESSYDSDDYPKGPYPDGGGEADSPQHCDTCGEFLKNPLTADGVAYVRGVFAEWDAPGGSIGRQCPPLVWREFYAAHLTDPDPEGEVETEAEMLRRERRDM